MSFSIMSRLWHIRERSVRRRYGASPRRPLPMTDERLPYEWREEGERRARERAGR